jgi:RimJ/RimL family protein N-acetyltransferase
VGITVREMRLDEVDLVVDYFHTASPEFLDTLGVDPTRLPEPVVWRQRYADEFEQPIDRRASLLVIWESDEGAVGFSTADKIAYGRHAHMHLHVVDPDRRNRGVGSAAVTATVRLYFDLLRLERIFCEPNAFNVAPNRTLQRVGFDYVKTYRTVPGRLNYHQAVTRWVLERDRFAVDHELPAGAARHVRTNARADP